MNHMKSNLMKTLEEVSNTQMTFKQNRLTKTKIRFTLRFLNLSFEIKI
jgi:hypothetical protein